MRNIANVISQLEPLKVTKNSLKSTYKLPFSTKIAVDL